MFFRGDWKTEWLRDHGHNKIFRLTKAKVIELRAKEPDWDVWQSLVERTGGATGEVADSDESSTGVKD